MDARGSEGVCMPLMVPVTLVVVEVHRGRTTNGSGSGGGRRGAGHQVVAAIGVAVASEALLRGRRSVPAAGAGCRRRCCDARRGGAGRLRGRCVHRQCVGHRVEGAGAGGPTVGEGKRVRLGVRAPHRPSGAPVDAARRPASGGGDTDGAAVALAREVGHAAAVADGGGNAVGAEERRRVGAQRAHRRRYVQRAADSNSLVDVGVVGVGGRRWLGRGLVVTEKSPAAVAVVPLVDAVYRIGVCVDVHHSAVVGARGVHLMVRCAPSAALLLLLKLLLRVLGVEGQALGAARWARE